MSFRRSSRRRGESQSPVKYTYSDDDDDDDDNDDDNDAEIGPSLKDEIMKLRDDNDAKIGTSLKDELEKLRAIKRSNKKIKSNRKNDTDDEDDGDETNDARKSAAIAVVKKRKRRSSKKRARAIKRAIEKTAATKKKGSTTNNDETRTTIKPTIQTELKTTKDKIVSARKKKKKKKKRAISGEKVMKKTESIDHGDDDNYANDNANDNGTEDESDTKLFDEWGEQDNDQETKLKTAKIKIVTTRKKKKKKKKKERVVSMENVMNKTKSNDHGDDDTYANANDHDTEDKSDKKLSDEWGIQDNDQETKLKTTKNKIVTTRKKKKRKKKKRERAVSMEKVMKKTKSNDHGDDNDYDNDNDHDTEDENEKKLSDEWGIQDNDQETKLKTNRIVTTRQQKKRERAVSMEKVMKITKSNDHGDDDDYENDNEDDTEDENDKKSSDEWGEQDIDQEEDYFPEFKQGNKRRRKNSNKYKISNTTIPHQPLTPGDQFITIYGIVQVISDDRIPSDYGCTPRPNNLKNLNSRFRRKKERIANTKERMATYLALLQMQRKNQLIDLNQNYTNHTNQQQLTNTNQNERDIKMAADIWDIYSPNTNPNHILAGLSVNQIWKGKGLKGRAPPVYNGSFDFDAKKKNLFSWDPGPDPRVPKDSYPDRLVECILIPDTRNKFHDAMMQTKKTRSATQGLMLGPKLIYNAAIDKKMERNNGMATTKHKKHNNAEDVNVDISINDNNRLTNIVNHESGMKLYLRRNLLKQLYNPLVSIYTCTLCGRSFHSWMSLKYHITENVCKTHGKSLFEERCTRLENLEADIVTAKTTPLSPPKKAFPKRRPLGPGEKKPPKRKKGKKYPSWLLFYPDSSPIYPEVYDYVGFKRGSNNNKFMKQKADKFGPGRKKRQRKRDAMRENAARRRENKDAVYPQIWKFLFAGISSAERRIELYDKAYCSTVKTRLRTPLWNSRKSLPQNKPSTHIKINNSKRICSPCTPIPPLQLTPSKALILVPIEKMNAIPQPTKEAVNQEKSSSSLSPFINNKRKRNLSPVANPKPPVSQNVVVDIRPLVEEMRGGRYPSMKPYVGHHPDICFLCKTDRGNVYFCEFCSNSEHLECVQSKINVRDPEPDDEFMCHQCIGNVQSRRNRAEKRRLQKLDDSLGLATDTIAGSGDGVGIATILSTAANPAMNASAATKREVVWSESDFDCHRVSYGKCPIGGPGGLICCRSCSTAYSRFLVNTSREMEGQKVSKGGRDVSELMELLLDAQLRLKQSVDVMNANDIRRTLLDRDEIELHKPNNANRVMTEAFGISDMFE